MQTFCEVADFCWLFSCVNMMVRYYYCCSHYYYWCIMLLVSHTWYKQQQQQQPFNSPLIQNNTGEPVPEIVGHINLPIITILFSSQHLQSSLSIYHMPSHLACPTSNLCTFDLLWFLFASWESLRISLPPLTVWPLADLQQPHRWDQELFQCSPLNFTPAGRMPFCCNSPYFPSCNWQRMCWLADPSDSL